MTTVRPVFRLRKVALLEGSAICRPRHDEPEKSMLCKGST
jgi:hypothetical protein